MEVDLESLRSELRVSLQRTIELQQALDIAEGRNVFSKIGVDQKGVEFSQRT